jgi:ubiquinone/menaquinone biosynthesis C-methylase UbiE
MNDSYYDHVCKRYKVHIDLIANACKIDTRVMEVGCGMGNITRELVRRSVTNKRQVATDFCPKMLDLALLNLEQEISANKVLLCKGDMTNSNHFKWMTMDVIHSHGVLEHYGDLAIRETIEVQKRMGAKTLVHYVPGEKYEKPSFGDERLLSVDAWKKICEPTEIYTFNQGFDYALVWDLK